MDAHSDYLMRLAEARLNDLRREARDERLARARTAARSSVRGRSSRWQWLRLPIRRRQAGSVGDVIAAPVSLPGSDATETSWSGRAWEDVA